MAEKLSVKLNEMLGEKDRNTVAGLFNFAEKLEEFYDKATCTPEERESIANKELNITYLVEQIVKIKKMHIPNEEKKNLIQDLLRDAPIDYILEETKAEIEKVKGLMFDKAKEATREIQSQFGDLEQSFNKLIDEGIKTEEEVIEDAEAKKKKLLEESKEQSKEETQMVKYEGNGFLDKFHRIREEGKIETGKKTGFFKSLFAAGKEYLNENKEIREKKFEATMPAEEEKPNEEVAKLEQEIKDYEDKIKSAKSRIKEFEKEKPKGRSELLKAFDEIIELAKYVFDLAVEPIKEVTEERCTSMVDRIEAFREGRKEAKHQNKIGSLEEKIAKALQERGQISSEIRAHSAEREQVVSGIVDGKDVDVDRRELDKDINYEIKSFEKMTRKVQRLEEKKARENEKYARRSNRNEGMDR